MSKQRPHFVQLEKNDDANSVRDRISFVRGERVLLVWPEEGTVLTRKLDLVLVQREAMRRAIRLALVTHDPMVVEHAKELNISTFETIGESDRKTWKRGRSKVFTSRFQKPENEPHPDELKDVASRVYTDDPTPTQTWLGRVGLMLGFVVVMALMAYLFLPSATVTLIPERTRMTLEVPIVASASVSEVDVENKRIPITRLVVEVTENGTVETNGQQALNRTRAVGSVTFINKTANTVEIPEGTIVTTTASDPISFRTINGQTLTAGVGQQVDVGIEALQAYAGEVGNVDANLINAVFGALAEQIEVRNLSPTSGGTNEVVSVITEEDITRLEAMVRQQIQARAFTEIEPRLSESQFIILESIRIAEERDDWKTYSGAVNDVADTITLSMKSVVEAVAVDEQFARQIAFGQLSSAIPSGRVIVPETLQYARGTSQLLPDGEIAFQITIEADVVAPIQVDQIAQQIAFKSVANALTYLLNDVRLQSGAVPQITLSPNWLRRMPILPFRIKVITQEPPI